MAKTSSRQQNVVLFSAGLSQDKCQLIKTTFAGKYRCYYWEEIFSNAADSKKIALLPMLIKKIPTFDFAIIVADGVDEADINQATRVKGRVMRDNVLFECGLCIMALGPERVILLIEDGIRIPDDLIKVQEELGITIIKYRNPTGNRKDDNLATLSETLEQVSDVPEFLKTLEKGGLHIADHATRISPVVIGAAISSADGYFNNFVLRFWEHVPNGLYDTKTNRKLEPDLSMIQVNVCLPDKITSDLKAKIRNYYQVNGYRDGNIPDGGPRGIGFSYKETADKFIVCDIPTTITASYTTVKDILELKANESDPDTDAEERFFVKELDSFYYALERLLDEQFLALKLRESQAYKDKNQQPDEAKILAILPYMKQVRIIQLNTRMDPDGKEEFYEPEEQSSH